MADVITSTPIRDSITSGGSIDNKVKNFWLRPQGSDEPTSPSFNVEYGTVVVLASYLAGGVNSGDSWKADLISVVRPADGGTRMVDQCSSCGPTFEKISVPSSDQFFIPLIMDGKKFTLTETNNTMVVTLPGIYRVVVSDDTNRPQDLVIRGMKYAIDKFPVQKYIGG